MSQVHPQQYLQSRIQTASAPQLHLMLIEGAIRFCRQAEFEFERENGIEASHFLSRATDIVAELLAGVRHDDSQLNQTLASLYQYLFYTLSSAYANSDRKQVADVLRLLEIERETWQMAVAKLRSQASSGTPIVAPYLVGEGLVVEGSVSFEA